MNKVKLTGQVKSHLKYPFLFLLILVAVNIEVYMINLTAGMLVTVGIAGYAVVLFVLISRYQATMLDNLVTFATQYGQIQKRMIKELAVPYALTDDRGRVLWFNDAFARMTGREPGKFHKSIASIFNGLTVERFPARNDEIDYEIAFNERNYELKVRNIVLDDLIDSSQMLEREDDESQCMYAFTFFDNTELREYTQKYKDETLACGYMVLDNCDEALSSVEEVKRSLLRALIDRKISKYFHDMDGIVRKYDEDRYLLIIRSRTLEELKKKKFSILEEIKTVNIGNDMAVTMSIGIGVRQGSYSANMDYARFAIDLALGRGGDQVVIRDGDDIAYFGARTQAVEKSSRVKARIKAHALAEFIESKQKVVVMGHKQLDIDAFGASVGIFRAARTLNKPAYIVIDEVSSTTKPFIDKFKSDEDYDPRMFLNIHDSKEMVDENTLLVVVDTSKQDYTECSELLNQTSTIVVLDHHRQTNDCIANASLSYIEPYASSTCEMIAEILQYIDGVKIKPLEADAMYAGIIIDTNNFMNKAGVRTFEAAAFLRRSGADMTRVRKMVREDFDTLHAKGVALENAEMFRDHYIISECPSGNLISPTIVGAEAANELLDIRGVHGSFVLTEYNGKIYISARSIDEVNVQIIMERLGGGGHLNVAGAQLERVSIGEAKERLKRVIAQMLDNGDI